MKSLMSSILLVTCIAMLLHSLTHCEARVRRTNIRRFSGSFANSVVRNCRPIMRALCHRVIYKCKIGVFRRKRSINTGYGQGWAVVNRRNVKRRRRIHANCHTCRSCM